MAKDRALLRVASSIYSAIYVSVVFVAFATSGGDLFRGAIAWYAASWPLLYAGACSLASFGLLDRVPRPAVVAFHIVSLPAVLVSFAGVGFFLPLLALLWWRNAGRPKLWGRGPR